jgi:hypothetical protein
MRTNIDYHNDNGHLYESVQAAVREIEYRLSILPVIYDKGKDIYVMKDDSFIYVYANPVLPRLFIREDGIEEIEHLPNMYIEYRESKSKDVGNYWTDRGAYLFGNAAQTFVAGSLPKFVITIPSLIIILNHDGGLRLDGRDGFVIEALKNKQADMLSLSDRLQGIVNEAK